MKCSWSSFSFCVTWPHRRQHPLAWFLSLQSSFPFLPLHLPLSRSSAVCTPLTPASDFSHFAWPLPVPHTCTQTQSAAPKRTKKFENGHRVREIPPPAQPPELKCLQLLPSTLGSENTHTHSLGLLSLNDAGSFSVSLSFSSLSKLFPPLLPSRHPPPSFSFPSLSLSSLSIFHHHPPAPHPLPPISNPPPLN